MKGPRSLLLALGLAMAAAFVPGAQAQNGGGVSVIAIGVTSGRLVSEVNIPVLAHGQVVVSFHGDPTAGCATYGLCPYSGTIVVRPRVAGLAVGTYRRGGRLERVATLAVQPGLGQYLTGASVERTVAGQVAGLCADAESGFAGPSAVVRGGRMTIRLFTAAGNSLSTRCAGPLDRDLAAGSPSATIPLSRVLRGRTDLNLAGTSAFAAHGFAGTVSSTLVLRLGRPGRTIAGAAQFPPGIRTELTRIVTEHLAVVRLAGGLRVAVHGASDPVVCRLLDSCGSTGTLSLGPRVLGAQAEVLASGPARRPYRDFLTALGLSHAGRARGITVLLTGAWEQGPLTAELTQGAPACTDSTDGVDLFLELAPARGGLRGSGSAEDLRTRCPGPEVGSANPLFSAFLPTGALGHRVFTISARPIQGLQDDGYTVVPEGDLALTLRRGRLSQQVIREPGVPIG